MVAGGVEELDVQGLPFGLVVDVGLHGAGVVDHGLGAHPFLAADDAPVHVGQVVLLEPGRPLGRGAIGIDCLTVAALVQVIQGQQPRRCDERGLVFVDRVPAAIHRNIPCPGRNKGGHFPVALAVLGQHLIAAEDVVRARGEITVLEKGLLRNNLFRDRQQHIGIEKIQYSRHRNLLSLREKRP